MEDFTSEQTENTSQISDENKGNSIEESSTKSDKFPVGAVIRHRQYGIGKIAGHDRDCYIVHFRGEARKVPFLYRDLQLLEPNTDVELLRIKQAIREVLGDNGWLDTDLEMGKRWIGGTVKIIPGKDGQQEKEIPIEAFFKKIISVREKLRVLEQKVNNHSSLSHEEKIELEGYVTRCYGSLTSFNILFANKIDQFSGKSD